ncbi:MAG: hypothetical protein H7288_12015 [Kineosporiaceae bacterium]|nr:hypothetical protein [Aeromicrobium sp.]
MDLTLSLSDIEATTLRKRAEKDGVSEQVVALTALRQFLEDEMQTEAIGGSIDEVKRRYSSTMKRLGE